MQCLIGSQDIVCDVPSSYKSTLIRGNKVGKDKLESVGQNFRDNLIKHITQADGPKISDPRRRLFLRDEHYIGSINNIKGSTRL
jgi:hypothetical protein